jgi:hypothetical protein
MRWRIEQTRSVALARTGLSCNALGRPCQGYLLADLGATRDHTGQPVPNESEKSPQLRTGTS